MTTSTEQWVIDHGGYVINRGTCDYCGREGEIDLWMHERFAVENYSPGSLGEDDLVQTCPDCSTSHNMSHDPTQKRKQPRKMTSSDAPYRWL